MIRRTIYRAVIRQLLCLATCSGTLYATTPSAQFTVSATVADTCQATANTMYYGSYAAALEHSVSSVKVLCALGTSYRIGVQGGYAAEVANSGASPILRSDAPAIVASMSQPGTVAAEPTQPSVQADAAARREVSSRPLTGDSPTSLLLVTVSY